MKTRYSFLSSSVAIVVLTMTILLAVTRQAAAVKDDDITEPPVDIDGAYLGLFNIIGQEDDSPRDDRRHQFDYAGNLDISIGLDDQVAGFIQLQGGPGGGSLRLAGPELLVTDINVTYSHPREPLQVTFGSFDTPFGDETNYLNNNGYIEAHPLILNSLTFSGFAEAPISTLNSLGLKAMYAPEMFDITAAVTNGTSESAYNPDGDFEVVLTAGVRPIKDRAVRFGGAFMYSDDRDPSGSVGKGTEFAGWLLEGLLRSEQGVMARGFVSGFTYDDDIADTDDNVLSLMGELSYSEGRWHIAARFSTWIPEDDNGDGIDISGDIPNPGLAVTQQDQPVFVDQQVDRLQVGGGYQVFPHVGVKGEFFFDNYHESSGGLSTDVNGLLLAVTGTF